MQSPDASIISPNICPDNDINSMAMNTQTTAEVTAGCHTSNHKLCEIKNLKKPVQVTAMNKPHI